MSNRNNLHVLAYHSVQIQMFVNTVSEGACVCGNPPAGGRVKEHLRGSISCGFTLSELQ